jgi:hypothetical protein
METNKIIVTNDMKLDYTEKNRQYKMFINFLGVNGISVPNTIDAYSLLWLLDEIYIKLNPKELQELMNDLDRYNVELLGNRTKKD